MAGGVIFTWASGGLLVAMVALSVALPYLLRPGSPASEGERRLRPHFWLGYAIAILAFAHSWPGMSQGWGLRSDLTGLYLATGAFLLVLAQVVLGLLMRGVGARGRRLLRPAHFWLMAVIVALSFAHMVRNDAPIAGETGFMSSLRAIAPLLVGYGLMAVFVAMLPWKRWIWTSSRGPASRVSRSAAITLGVFHVIGLTAAPLMWWVFPRSPGLPIAAAWSGVVLMAAALASHIWAQSSLGPHYRITLGVGENQPLVEAGPYRWIRHPAYLAQMVFWLGLGVASRHILALALIAVAGASAYAYRIRCEEGMLAGALGERYSRYAARTRRLIPRVW